MEAEHTKCVQRGQATAPQGGLDRLQESILGLGGGKRERAFPGRSGGVKVCKHEIVVTVLDIFMGCAGHHTFCSLSHVDVHAWE